MRANTFEALLALTSVAHLCAQTTVPPVHQGLHLTLRCAATPCRFRLGEAIRVDLTFSADAADYGVLSTYPGRFDFIARLDKFTAHPAGDVADSLGAQSSGIVVGNSFNPTPKPLLQRTQVTVSEELNQWLRFLRPGRFMVTAVSSRACRLAEISCFLIWLPPNHVDLTSNPIEIEIVGAEPDWQRRQLELIVKALPATLFSKTDAQRAAVRALAYLGTEEALQEIRERLAANDEGMDLDWRFAQLVLFQRTSAPPVH